MEEMNVFSGVDNLEQVNNNEAEINRLKGELSLVVKEISQLRDQIKQREEDFKYEVEEREQDPEWRIAANDYLTKGDRSGIESYRDRDLQRKQLQLDKMNSYNTAILAANKNIEQMKKDLDFYKSQIQIKSGDERNQAIKQYNTAKENLRSYMEEMQALTAQRNAYINLNKVRGVPSNNMAQGVGVDLGQYEDFKPEFTAEDKWLESKLSNVNYNLAGVTNKKKDVLNIVEPLIKEAKSLGYDKAVLKLQDIATNKIEGTTEEGFNKGLASQGTNDGLDVVKNLDGIVSQIDSSMQLREAGEKKKTMKDIYDKVYNNKQMMDALKKKGYTWNGFAWRKK